jgi:hypothetical protein
MPTYNFTTGGDIYQYNNVIRSIDGPAALTPRDEADYFTLSYLGGSDIFYWNTNTFEIDGETFAGTLEEFCDAAQALFTSTGGGGGESWADITDSVAVEISPTKVLNITDDAGTSFIYASNGATLKSVGLGDIAEVIEEGPSASLYCGRNTGSNDSSISLTTFFDAYESSAYVTVQSQSATQSAVQIGVDTDTFTGQFKISRGGYSFSGVVEYADNAAALTGGLVAGAIYRTGDALKIVH